MCIYDLFTHFDFNKQNNGKVVKLGVLLLYIYVEGYKKLKSDRVVKFYMFQVNFFYVV